jgi:hypothetical protein
MDLQIILELVSAALTLSVLLYLFVGDNALFRAVTYSFIGVAAGYVLVLIIFQVLGPRLLGPLLRGTFDTEFIFALVALILGGLLLFKLSPRMAAFGNPSMAVLVGVGAAVAIGGAVFGTIFGQVNGMVQTFPSLGELFGSIQQGGFADRAAGFAEGIFVLFGTICTLAYFQHTVTRKPNLPLRRPRVVEILATIGQAFIGITLGATFAGVFAASIAAFIERIGFLITVLSQFM